ncbi:response regulator [Shewanella marinintestina]|uniref:tetratricopeptide repeat-containing response regulator n=1 Tax=Shewanella marinintestina TaxID=190305 RepID=UPI00201026AC|nr:tetratricopeptide repeat-containing response regulator [Shewanella marinintestina]MCL1147850.1 response regulator [Shewanella marinintestina]
MQSFQTLKLLVIDDAPTFLFTIKSMLVKLGFLEVNVLTAKSAKLALDLASNKQFDVIICDFNFGTGMNGKQLFEEFKHLKLLTDESVFVLVTGDNSAATVRPIIELKPDEYLLKPFNAITLKQRLSMAIRRRHKLAGLYAAERLLDAEQGLQLCDEMAPFHPEYYFVIERFRGVFLTILQRHEQAKSVYQSTLAKKDLDWAKVGLANSLANLGQITEAEKIINQLLIASPNDTQVKTEAAYIKLKDSDIPAAISHLELASQIVPGNSERELIIVNLCLSVEDYAQALARYRLYLEINKDTYRNNDYSKLSLIRVILYQARFATNKAALLEEAKHHLRSVIGTENEAITHEIELIKAHISMELGFYRSAISLLKNLHNKECFQHFYATYHYAWLLNIMSVENEFNQAISWCSQNLGYESNQIIFASKVSMLEGLKSHNEDKKSWLKEQYLMVKNGDLDKVTLLETYLAINETAPLLKTVCLNIIKSLTYVWPRRYGVVQVKEIIQRCDNVVRQLYVEDELLTINYQEYYQSALDKCKGRVD